MSDKEPSNPERRMEFTPPATPPETPYPEPIPAEVIFDTENLLVRIRLRGITLAPDRTQYKPYSPIYSLPFGVMIEVTVPLLPKYIADHRDDTASVVLTPAGMAHVADQLATALDDMHNDFKNRDRKY